MIELICANSSQAKGRVERVNKTLQDRLIKEMRLQNISSVAEANQWIEHFMSDFNRRFSRPAKYPKDLHRAVTQSPLELNDIFAWQELRTLSKALTFQYDKVMYIIEPTEQNTRIAGEKSAVLRLAQQKQEELEAEGKRMRSTKMPRRRAQERALEELRAIAGQSAGFYPQPEAMSPSLTCGSDMADR